MWWILGLRYMLLGSRQMDAGHILENVVYLEFIRRINARDWLLGLTDH